MKIFQHRKPFYVFCTFTSATIMVLVFVEFYRRNFQIGSIEPYFLLLPFCSFLFSILALINSVRMGSVLLRVSYTRYGSAWLWAYLGSLFLATAIFLTLLSGDFTGIEKIVVSSSAALIIFMLFYEKSFWTINEEGLVFFFFAVKWSSIYSIQWADKKQSEIILNRIVRRNKVRVDSIKIIPGEREIINNHLIDRSCASVLEWFGI